MTSRDNFVTFGTDKHEHFIVELRPTTKCNYNCYYCPDLHINSNPIKNINHNDLKELLVLIRERLNKKIHVFICGGEPTLYKGLAELILSIGQYLNVDDIITVQTNLSKNLDWIKQFTNKIKHLNGIVRINGSYHNTQQVNIYDYITKCLYLKQSKLLGLVSFSYNAKKCTKSDYFKFTKLVGERHSEIVPLINGSVDQNAHKSNGSDKDIDIIYQNEHMDEFKNYGSFFVDNLSYTTQTQSGRITHAEMWKTRYNNFKGYTCSVTKHKLYVDWDGSCYGCFNHQFSPEPPLFYLHEYGKIDEYFRTSRCIKCPFTTCFFDLEYLKTQQSGDIDEIKINRKFNTKEYRHENS